MEKCPGYYCAKRSVVSKFDWNQYEAVRTSIMKFITCFVCKCVFTVEDVASDGTFEYPYGWIEIRREGKILLICSKSCLDKADWKTL